MKAYLKKNYFYVISILLVEFSTYGQNRCFLKMNKIEYADFSQAGKN